MTAIQPLVTIWTVQCSNAVLPTLRGHTVSFGLAWAQYCCDRRDPGFAGEVAFAYSGAICFLAAMQGHAVTCLSTGRVIMMLL